MIWKQWQYGKQWYAKLRHQPMQWKQYERGDWDPLVFLKRSALIPLLTDVRNNHRYSRDTSFASLRRVC